MADTPEFQPESLHSRFLEKNKIERSYSAYVNEGSRKAAWDGAVLWCKELRRSDKVNKPGRGLETEDQFPDLL